MNTYSEFIEEIKLHGFESIGLYYGCYRGSVVSNEDPDNLGRLKIKCPAIYGDQIFEEFIFPKGVQAGIQSGIFWLPSPGDPVWISCEGGNPRFPIWEYGWWLKDKTIPGAEPKVYVFLTPSGHRVELSDKNNWIDIKHKSGFHVKLFEDGIYFGKAEHNLGKLLDDLFQLFSTTTVATVAGPSPFNNVTAYNSLRNQIQSFLKTSE
jgi:hypothetical protein